MERGHEVKAEAATQERLASSEGAAVLTAYSYEKDVTAIQVDEALGFPLETPNTILQPSNHRLDEFTKILIGEAEFYGVDPVVTGGWWHETIRYRAYMEEDLDHCEVQKEILAAIEALGHQVLDEDDTVLIWAKTSALPVVPTPVIHPEEVIALAKQCLVEQLRYLGAVDSLEEAVGRAIPDLEHDVRALCFGLGRPTGVTNQHATDLLDRLGDRLKTNYDRQTIIHESEKEL